MDFSNSHKQVGECFPHGLQSYRWRFVSSFAMIMLPSLHKRIDQNPNVFLFRSVDNHLSRVQCEDHFDPHKELSNRIVVIMVPPRILKEIDYAIEEFL